MDWRDNLPAVDKWKPRSHKSETLRDVMLLNCKSSQSRLVREANIEKQFNIDNYDSGVGLEDLMRQELSSLLPTRYCVDAGVVND